MIQKTQPLKKDAKIVGFSKISKKRCESEAKYSAG